MTTPSDLTDAIAALGDGELRLLTANQRILEGEAHSRDSGARLGRFYATVAGLLEDEAGRREAEVA